MTKRAASRLRLSVLDQSPISEGSTLGTALRNSIDLAVLAESMGYHRYWVAEHHGSPGLDCMSPEILIGPIAAATSRLRVGSGGVMLPHYSPFKVAESFMLASLFPGRIELGVGRASGSDRITALALQRDRRQAPADDFPDQLTELISYCGAAEQRRAEGTPQANLVTHERPQLWLLGSSAQSAVWAADLGLSCIRRLHQCAWRRRCGHRALSRAVHAESEATKTGDRNDACSWIGNRRTWSGTSISSNSRTITRRYSSGCRLTRGASQSSTILLWERHLLIRWREVCERAKEA